jgi:pimeloyl-ACP methyl ester carboxylesterase
MAALDVLKANHGFTRFHLVGQSGGGHTVAALVQKRADIGCAVMASAVASVKSRERERGRAVSPRVYDPIDAVGAMQHQPGRRMIMLSDPKDRIVSFRSQREFAERVKAKGLPLLHVTASAGDKEFHGLSGQGHRVATDCAKGMDDEALVARHQAKPALAARRQ